MRMRWMIASDIHGSAVYCQQLLTAYAAEKADRLLLLGDILYHGPRNALPEGYDPARTAALLNAHCADILCVQGNCDSEVDQMVLDFPIGAAYCLLCAGGRTIFVTHGHVMNLEHLPAMHPGDILLHGHTHVQAWEQAHGVTYVNPGSVSIPKQDSVRGYLILTDEAFEFKALDGRCLRREAL